MKHSGVRKVLFHSDGNIEGILDMLVDAGVDGINPVEPRAGLDAVIGVHSVGPDIPVGNYEHYINLIDKHGVF